MTTTATTESQAQEPVGPVEPVVGVDLGSQNLVAALGFDRERLPLIVPNDLGALSTPFVSFLMHPCHQHSISTTTTHA